MEIFARSLSYRRNEGIIRSAFFDKQVAKTPVERPVDVEWHVGESGTGKSRTYVELCEQCGRGNVYLVTDYLHGFDKYQAESVLFMDEFRGDMPYARFLAITDIYLNQIPCRYSNVYGLWNKVVIASVLPPDIVFRNMVKENQTLDTYAQLARRIGKVVYHWIDDDGKYRQYDMPMLAYVDYETLKNKAEDSIKPEQMELPF